MIDTGKIDRKEWMEMLGEALIILFVLACPVALLLLLVILAICLKMWIALAFELVMTGYIFYTYYVYWKTPRDSLRKVEKG